MPMARVTSKYQVTVPRKIAEAYGITPGVDIWVPAGDVIRVVPPGKQPLAKTARRGCACSTRRRNAIAGDRRPAIRDSPANAAGNGRSSIKVAALVDTTILVYRFDDHFPGKQKIATEILRLGMVDDSVRVPHQAIIEFVAAMTRPIRGRAILRQADALREAEEMLSQFTVVYPNEAILRNAVRGCAAYQLNWSDAQIWSYPEHYGLSQILTEDLPHDRLYGTVRVLNPSLDLH
jgi:predicted nucleic acid-binding protein/bifunctional DNA-binding transcriptional regulator/antitoxin component of YhaV-PrlF toxin-antitoxin module